MRPAGEMLDHGGKQSAGTQACTDWCNGYGREKAGLNQVAIGDCTGSVTHLRRYPESFV